MALAARDVIPVPVDNTASWISDKEISLNLAIVLMMLVVYDTGTRLSIQLTCTGLTTILVITLDKEVP